MQFKNYKTITNFTLNYDGTSYDTILQQNNQISVILKLYFDSMAHRCAISIPVTLVSVHLFTFPNISKTTCAMKFKFHMETMGRGNESLFKWSLPHDQDGRNAYIW